MPNNCDNCKANLVELARNTQGTPTAKLIAVLIASGITDNKTLADIIGVKVRAIQCARRATECAQLNAHAQYNAPKAQQVAPNATECAQLNAPLARAYKESPSEIVITKKDSPLTPQGGFDDPHNSEGVELDANGRVTLVNGVRQFWLDQFGGDVERLSLALLQVSVQPNSRRPIRAQVESQLARQASQRRDQDARYSAAVKSNPRNKPPPDTLEGHYTAPLPDKPLVPVLDEWR
jgi:hypothetical protein